ncbi:MAG: NAD(+) diphosphatase, partial [Bacillota bacterium]|nr:NAD(+) diphosphatase [Bacillota bacterium]
SLKHIHYLGELEGRNCYTAELDDEAAVQGEFRFENLRSVLDLMDEKLFLVCSRAVQIVAWDKDHRFCGRCGSPMEPKPGERAKQCTSCGFTNYPRISPAIIVAVTKGDKLLMAHNKNFRPGFYSVIAGFVDPGETFEQCVKREVIEEVGIRVRNIKYFRSQPWPFPNSLMVAFTAEYDGGEICEDGIEIEHADWYTVENMPSRPLGSTVAGKLIEWFISGR